MILPVIAPLVCTYMSLVSREDYITKAKHVASTVTACGDRGYDAGRAIGDPDLPREQKQNKRKRMMHEARLTSLADCSLHLPRAPRCREDTDCTLSPCPASDRLCLPSPSLPPWGLEKRHTQTTAAGGCKRQMATLS